MAPWNCEGLAEEGHRVRVAYDGPSGLTAAVGADRDVIVLDIMLPGLSGCRVLQLLRARRVLTLVLMLTARDGEYDEADALDLGCRRLPDQAVLLRRPAREAAVAVAQGSRSPARDPDGR